VKSRRARPRNNVRRLAESRLVAIPVNAYDRYDVAELLGVDVTSVTRYVNRGDMPKPSGRIGGAPWWDKDIIDAWILTRPGKGANAGRPKGSRNKPKE
jgi:predicted DNA-binding transcriptional regulator AlpA